MRWVMLFWVPMVLAAQDPYDIVRKSLADDQRAIAVSLNYTYLEQTEVRTLEGPGKYKVRQKDVRDITLLEGSPYKRLISQLDKPLSPKDEAKEQEKLRRSIEERHAESPEQRQARIDDWKHKQEKQHEPMTEVPDGFFLKMAPDDKIDGFDTWVIDATPKPGYKPKTKGSFFLPKVKMRMWITKDGYHPVKLEFETLDTIAWGGIVARVNKGTHLRLELTRVNDEVWLPKRILITGTARVLLVKSFTGDIDLTYSNYKKFVAESRIVSVEH